MKLFDFRILAMRTSQAWSWASWQVGVGRPSLVTSLLLAAWAQQLGNLGVHNMGNKISKTDSESKPTFETMVTACELLHKVKVLCTQ